MTNLSEIIIPALGWTVLHSLWQGLMIGAIFFIIRKLSCFKSNYKYWIATTGLYLLFITSVCTFCWLVNVNSPTETTSQIELIGKPFVFEIAIEEGMIEEVSILQSVQNYLDQHINLIVWCWWVGLLCFAIRFFGGILYLEYLKRVQIRFLPKLWQEKVGAIAHRLATKKSIRLASSPFVDIPLVIGFLKPIILLPVGMINALSSEEVEAILAHEIAHITRNDYLLNLIQSFIEVLMYFNPIVWWFSAWIKEEREFCCDDLAVKITGSSILYAKALVTLQEKQKIKYGYSQLAMGLFKNKKSLLNRVSRILNQSQTKSTIMDKLSITLLLVTVFFFFSMESEGRNNTEEILPEIEIESAESNLLEADIKLENTNPFINTPKAIPANPKPEGKRVFFKRDTLPKGLAHIVEEKNGEKVEVLINEGEIINLVINGKEIPKEEFAQYEQLVINLIKDRPAPPTPPTPPSPPSFDVPSQPGPPNPPSSDLPTPPTPPSPPGFDDGSSSYIRTQKDDDGNTRIKIKRENGEEIDMVVKDILSVKGGRRMVIGENDEDMTIYLDELDNVGEYDALIEEITIAQNDAKTLNRKLQERALNFERFLELDSLQSEALIDVELMRGELLESLLDKLEHVNQQKAFNMERDFLKNFDFLIDTIPMPDVEEIISKALNDVKISIDTDKILEDLELDLSEIKEKVERVKLNMEEVTTTVEAELLKDGFVKNGEKYKFEISKSKMWVNGVRQTDEIHAKYKALLKREFVDKFGGEIMDRDDDILDGNSKIQWNGRIEN